MAIRSRLWLDRHHREHACLASEDDKKVVSIIALLHDHVVDRVLCFAHVVCRQSQLEGFQKVEERHLTKMGLDGAEDLDISLLADAVVVHLQPHKTKTSRTNLKASAKKGGPTRVRDHLIRTPDSQHSGLFEGVLRFLQKLFLNNLYPKQAV